ncbi:MAG: RNA-binding protein [Christensenellales bacterium]|jgi:large subunit ribosomal protein L14e
MNKYPTDIGRVVVSKAGRDEGRRFVVIEEIDGDFVRIANGLLRTMGRPKKKRRRHLQATETVLEDIRRRIMAGEIVEDHMLRKALKIEEG